MCAMPKEMFYGDRDGVQKAGQVVKTKAEREKMRE